MQFDLHIKDDLIPEGGFYTTQKELRQLTNFIG